MELCSDGFMLISWGSIGLPTGLHTELNTNQATPRRGTGPGGSDERSDRRVMMGHTQGTGKI